MYETEANRQKESSEQIPPHILAHFGELKGSVIRRTVLPWSEHCTECVWPSCYTSCDLYSAREDGRCRRFVDGMVRIDCAGALNSYLLRITFKRWAKLWTPGNIRLRTLASAGRVENRDYHIGSALNSLLLPGPVRILAAGKRYSLKKRLAYRAVSNKSAPSAFLLECYNPDAASVNLSFTIRSIAEMVTIPYQKLVALAPGFNRIRIPYTEIAAIVDVVHPFNVEMVPNGERDGLTLIFGLIDFVQELPQSVAVEKKRTSTGGKHSKVKCVVWDLDNTMWDGILVEGSGEKLVLKQGMRQVLEDLDSRGILQSVASKNNHDEAWTVLKRLGIDELFLAPQISWGPKSWALQQIAQRLNLGLDSLLFVDDSEFELQEVRSALSEIRTFNAARFHEIPGMEECQVPVTAESRERRKMYRLEEERRSTASNFAGDYVAFLRNCEIKLNVLPLSDENLERVHELTQRTNQMNFSGNRYDREVLRDVLATPWLDAYVLEAEDRFGTYGVVGFSIVDSREPRMTDLMFSCRIQSKRIEHAFLMWLIRQYADRTGKPFLANYRKTPRNAPSGKVFEEIGMQEVGNTDGVSRLIFPLGQSLSEDGIVTIAVHDPRVSHKP